MILQWFPVGLLRFYVNVTVSEAIKTLSKMDKRKAVRQSWREKAALMSREDLAAAVVPYVVNSKRARKAKGKAGSKGALSKVKSKLKLKKG